jgi:GNAT superfamily N-acetyltransferase
MGSSHQGLLCQGFAGDVIRIPEIIASRRLKCKVKLTYGQHGLVDASAAGSIAVRPESHAQWIEHFYLIPEHQGQGLGNAVLRHVMMTQQDHRPFRLNVLQSSSARRLYERHGFVREHEGPIDVFLTAKTDQA